MTPAQCPRPFGETHECKECMYIVRQGRACNWYKPARLLSGILTDRERIEMLENARQVVIMKNVTLERYNELLRRLNETDNKINAHLDKSKSKNVKSKYT